MLNHRQHRFCINILAGMPPQEAYKDAGYDCSPESLRVRPYAIMLEPDVKAFIEEKRRLKEAVVLANDINQTIASPSERKEILTELLRAQLVDFVDENGQPVLNKGIPNARAIKEYSIRKHYDKDGKEVTSKSIKLSDIVSAIQELNKMDGSYAPSKHLIANKTLLEVVLVDKTRSKE